MHAASSVVLVQTPDSVTIAHWGVLWRRMGEAEDQAGEEFPSEETVTIFILDFSNKRLTFE